MIDFNIHGGGEKGNWKTSSTLPRDLTSGSGFATFQSTYDVVTLSSSYLQLPYVC